MKSGRFSASIRVNGKNRSLGTFDTAREAAARYNAEAIAADGEWADLNPLTDQGLIDRYHGRYVAVRSRFIGPQLASDAFEIASAALRRETQTPANLRNWLFIAASCAEAHIMSER